MCKWSNEETKTLCLRLMEADTESEVIDILEKAGLWNCRAVWRNYGDIENNFSSIGNQQSRADSALVEKITNAIDARLTNECLVKGIDPEGPEAPATIQDAVAAFFGGGNTAITGWIRNWPDAKRTEVGRGITLAATGSSSNPSFTISDCGEGQTPDMMPLTFLSLERSNKLRIPFVQGKFNMGGTGVLKFCGRNNLQLIVSRRNPEILRASTTEDDLKWGFTIVRRENPTGNERSSVFTYLAPWDYEENPRKGGVLRFAAENMPIFPQGRKPYGRAAEWGSLIKLYEYSVQGFSRSHILRKDGLLSRLDILLPDIALPIRLYECRPTYRGGEASFETTLNGLGVRLDDDKGENLESGFPTSSPVKAMGEQMTVTVFAFKRGRADTYRRNEGIIFTLNGQTHGHFQAGFFRRPRVGLSYLADSLLIIVDCSAFTRRACEDLFMNSRDRLSNCDLRKEMESSLEELLRHHEGLRALREQRRREEVASRLQDTKPLEDVLQSILRRSPVLSSLFLQGKRIQNPFRTESVSSSKKPFKGERFPTYFKFRGKDYGREIIRDCHINTRCRVFFETDATNDYFSRRQDRGEFSLLLKSDRGFVPVDDYYLSLHNGVASLSLRLPAGTTAGRLLQFETRVCDTSRWLPFVNCFSINVKEPALSDTGSKGHPPKDPPSNERGREREKPIGIALPSIIEVREKDWRTKSPPFDQYTALRIINAGDGESSPVYDFLVNMDNVYLKSEMKASGDDPGIVSARFKFGLVLIGLAIIQEDISHKNHATLQDAVVEQNDAETSAEQTVETITRAISPVLLPLIDTLGALEAEGLFPEDNSSGEVA